MTAPVPAGPTDAQGELREEIARALWEDDGNLPTDYTNSDRVMDDYRSNADAVLALPTVRDALAAQETARPCPTCVREGGPYRCCPHCADDPGAHEDGQRNHHDLPCTTCLRDLRAGDR